MDTLRSILLRPMYATTALVVALLVFTLAVWLPNWRLILTIIPTESATFWEKVSLLLSLFGSIQTNFTIVSATYTIAIAILFGINVVVLANYIRTRRGSFSSKGSVAGVGGLVSGFLGIGCAACGTFILTALLSLFGAASLLTFLPLGGEEFGILGVILLLYSIYVIIKKTREPLVCEPVPLKSKNCQS